MIHTKETSPRWSVVPNRSSFSGLLFVPVEQKKIMRNPRAVPQTAATQRALRDMEFLARLMDSRFRIPGTDIRFGLDALIGLIPGAGDLSTFAVSGYMLLIMARNGASGYVLARMTFNILVDVIIGSIPLLGDLFDFVFKANMRNMRLMQQHYREGRHRGSAWKVIIPILIILFIIIVGLVWGIYRLIAWIF
jgi:hypothetical protein